jgi:hypothetical protein
MIVSIMHLSIWVVVTVLFGLMFSSVLLKRAERLRTQRLEAATPQSILKLRADRDQFRAELAMSIRRLETSVERMKTKTEAYLVLTNKKDETIGDLTKELSKKSAAIMALEMRGSTVGNQLGPPFETDSLRESAQTRFDNKAELRRRLAALAERSRLLDASEFDIKRRRDQLNTAGDIEDDL